MVEVTQADRERAADAVKAYRDQRNGNWQQRIRDGQCDDGEMVQAFACHRTEATAELVEAARELAAWYGPFNPTKHPPEINGAWLRMQAALAKHLTDGPGLTERLEN